MYSIRVINSRIFMFLLQMDLSEDNAVSSSGFKPTKRLKGLEDNTSFAVSDIKRVNTRYGLKTVIELDKFFEVFLPKRVNDVVDKKQKVYDYLCDAVQKNKLCLHTFKKRFFEFQLD